MVLRTACFGVLLLATGARAADGPHECFSRAETRQWIHTEKLAEPFEIVRKIAESSGAEALSARLCRTDSVWSYEINLLDASGRVIRAVVDARSGRTRLKSR